jgi:ketosteroid isomerase-like protein
METTEVLKRFIGAVASGDYDTMAALYAPDIRVWHSTDRAWQEGAEENIAAARRTLSTVTGFRHAVDRYTATPNGAVAEGALRGSTKVGELDTPFCLVATIKDGRITEAREYIDQGHFPR